MYLLVMSKDCGGDFFALIGVTLNSSCASLEKLAFAGKGTAHSGDRSYRDF
jgi:hypothetical protein